MIDPVSGLGANAMPVMSPAARRIFIDVTTARGVTAAQLRSPGRQRELCHARAEICARLTEEQGYSLSKIGRLLDRKHSTILRTLRNWDAIKTQPIKATSKAHQALLNQAPPPPPSPILQPRGEGEYEGKVKKKRLYYHPGYEIPKQDSKRHPVNRVQAIDAQIKRAEQYGQPRKAEALREHRALVIAGRG